MSINRGRPSDHQLTGIDGRLEEYIKILRRTR
jgi:hypothetical protein